MAVCRRQPARRHRNLSSAPALQTHVFPCVCVGRSSRCTRQAHRKGQNMPRRAWWERRKWGQCAEAPLEKHHRSGRAHQKPPTKTRPGYIRQTFSTGRSEPSMAIMNGVVSVERTGKNILIPGKVKSGGQNCLFVALALQVMEGFRVDPVEREVVDDMTLLLTICTQSIVDQRLEK